MLIPAATSRQTRLTLAAMCVLVLLTYWGLRDLKGISSDEGFRMGITNGGQSFTAGEPAMPATWPMVLETVRPHAYQPGYFLLLNSVMRFAHSHSADLFKGVNLGFLALSLAGLLTLSSSWRLVPRLFLLGFFSFNAYLLMHVLQIREYIVGVTFYIWSTWLVLRLEARPLRTPWPDTLWYAAYGMLLALGFFVQTWVVFPALAQGLFLVLRRREDRGRFYAHLALSYFIVLAFTWPYLQSHGQKASVGPWGSKDSLLLPQLSDGFHLVLSGHPAHTSAFTSLLFWLWPAVVAFAAVRFFRQGVAPGDPLPAPEYRRQGLLMLLCSGLSLAFQIAYFLKVENLSVWPRYFIIHYFFLSWLVALAFNQLYAWGTAGGIPAAPRRRFAFLCRGLAALLLVAAVFQVLSYRRNPYYDTGTSPGENWRLLAAGLSDAIQPGDTIVTQDFIHSWSLTFTRPFPNRVLSVPEVTAEALRGSNRLLYLEQGASAQRPMLAEQLAALGFELRGTLDLRGRDGHGSVPGWQLLDFHRR